MQLLVSVRSASEAQIARVWGASLIDVKEPSRGSLGRAGDAVIQSVLNQVGGVCPVSAALGELRDGSPLPWGWEALAYLKWGLAGCAGRDWKALLARRAERTGSRAVIVAYADAELTGAPAVEEVLAFACRRPWADPVLLVDTFDKSPSPLGLKRTLFDWLPLEKLAVICGACREQGVRVALAGSLGLEEVRRLVPLVPDWIAVRGAVCENNDRGQTLSAGGVHALVNLLQATTCGGSRP
jgi:uncharacterized protein (UPF0264 family)